MPTSNDGSPTLKDQIEDLRAQIEVRKSVLKEFISIVRVTIESRGKVTSQERHSAHTTTVWDLDFHEFKITYETGLSMMGGSTLQVTRGPDPLNLVFSMSSNSDIDDRDAEWKEVKIPNKTLFEDLLDKLKNRHDYFSKLDAEEAEGKQREAEQVALREEFDMLLGEASRLGVIGDGLVSVG